MEFILDNQYKLTISKSQKRHDTSLTILRSAICLHTVDQIQCCQDSQNLDKPSKFILKAAIKFSSPKKKIFQSSTKHILILHIES